MSASVDLAVLADESWRLSLEADRRSPKTVRTYIDSVRQLDAWLAEHDRPRGVADVTTADVRGFIAHLAATRSASTAATRYRGLQQFFKWAVAEREAEDHPMAPMRPPSLDTTPPAVIDDDTLARIFKACAGTTFEDRRATAILDVLLDTGIRVAELVGMTTASIDLRATPKTVTVLGKGRKTRTVALGKTTVRDLDRYRRERDRHPLADHDAWWLGVRAPLTDSGVRQMLERRCEQAGVERLTPHRFRHTFAHQWLAAGGSERDLMALAGWKSPQMLGRYGASLAAERARDAHGRLSPRDRL